MPDPTQRAIEANERLRSAISACNTAWSYPTGQYDPHQEENELRNAAVEAVGSMDALLRSLPSSTGVPNNEDPAFEQEAPKWYREGVEQFGIRLCYRPSDKRYYAYRDGKFLFSGDAWFCIMEIALSITGHGNHLRPKEPETHIGKLDKE